MVLQLTCFVRSRNIKRMTKFRHILLWVTTKPRLVSWLAAFVNTDLFANLSFSITWVPWIVTLYVYSYVTINNWKYILYISKSHRTLRLHSSNYHNRLIYWKFVYSHNKFFIYGNPARQKHKVKNYHILIK